MRALARWAPAALLLLGLGLLWEWAARSGAVPPYLLPPPSRIGAALLEPDAGWWPAWVFTLKVCLSALGLACLTGVLGAAAFALSPLLERSLLPLAVVLQVTPLVAVAPLVLIYVDSPLAALLICAWLVAFFPILSGTLAGLRAVDRSLADLFTLYRASPLQRLRWLLLPGAAPYFLAGLRTGAGLALIGAVVAEFAAGAAGHQTGLASRLLEAMFRNDMPRMFAALSLIMASGLALQGAVALLERLWIGRWHGR
ncbi:NitT/TauT family transport system permease protein [Inhella inkyongensis]|uniref:NitT/TauT family transport system permease protein n=1 Tax=Inhella inkyongensis TaxID=392593 RepID=A0A840S463_9BURK|nr:ABC transporter permease subunit [Inhella inkyongensis]MBB5205155.1 NitT/TauT family transport system permease protein [Inhella inkyongensis]